MSEIDNTEKSLRDFAATRQKYAGSAPLRMPGPMRERLRLEIEAMSDCDSVFERKSGFGVGALLRILIPTAAVAAVTIVSFQAWEFDSSTPSSATASLQKEGVGADEEKAEATKSKAKQTSISVAAPQMPIPVVATSSAPAAPARILSERSLAMTSAAKIEPALAELDSLGIAMNRSQPSGALSLDSMGMEPSNRMAQEIPLAEPTASDYGEPREATLAPTIPVEMAKQLREPVATLRFRSTAPGSILSHFALRRVGDVIELTDSDGSRYTAEIAPAERKRARRAESDKDTDAQAHVEHFTVSGTNQTIGRKVLITGSIFASSIGHGDMSSGSGGMAVPETRIHAVIRIEGQTDPIAIEAGLDK